MQGKMILSNPFESFWMAGYECTDQLNCWGNRVDFLKLTGHLANLDNDYSAIQHFNLKTVREGIRWSQVEKIPYVYDWSTVGYMIECGQAQGIQQLWDICHFGFPDDLTPLHPMFARRFAAVCRSFVLFYRSLIPDGELIVTPINEVSFLSWLGGDVKGTVPYCTGQGWEVKYALMKAYIEGCHAMLEVDPAIRVLTTEPLINIVPPLNATAAEIEQASLEHAAQFQCLEILCGNICPELGGRPELLDILGFNYYYDNQWETGTHQFLPWLNEAGDERWLPLQALLQQVYEKYKRPLVLSETSHPGEDRALWMECIGQECAAVIELGIPLWGICIYPVIDRPDWDHPEQAWHHSGLWDNPLNDASGLARVLETSYAASLLEAQLLVGDTLSAYA